MPAQVGDTVQFRLAQPGNVNASTHDVWLQAPGGQPQFLGISYETPTVNAPLSQAGTYSFYCSIHGGQTSGGMNGTILVTTTNPGPPVDPGTPWTDPDWEDPEYPGDGPLPLPNDTEAPTVFEEGDNDAPLLEVLKVNPDAERESVRVRWDVSEAGFVTLRLKQGKKVVATKVVDVEEGEDAAHDQAPEAVAGPRAALQARGLGDRRGRDRLGGALLQREARPQLTPVKAPPRQASGDHPRGSGTLRRRRSTDGGRG